MPRRKSISTKQIQGPHWDAHETVLIRSLNTEDEEFIADGMISIASDMKSTEMHAGRTKRLTLQRAILSWTLTDERGSPMKVNEENIKALAPGDSKFILDEINALNAPLSPPEKKDSTMAASTGTEAKAQ